MSEARIRPRRTFADARNATAAMVAAAAVLAALVVPGHALAAVAASVPQAAAAAPTITPAKPGSLLFLGNKNLAPVVYLDGTVPAGLAVDLVRAMEPHLSKPVEIRAMDWKQAQGIVASGQADALIQINSTPERKAIYDFSDPLLESHFAIFVRADQPGVSGISGLRGLRVGVEAGGLPQQLLGKDPEIPLTVIRSFPEGFGMLNSGAIDAVVVDYRVGSYVLATNRFEGIKVTGDPIASSYSAIAVRKGNTALLAEINRALRAIRADGTYKSILANWETTVGVFETQAQINERMYRTASVVLLSLLVVVVAWALTIRLQMRRRRAAENALAKREEMYRSLVAGMAEGVVFETGDGRIAAVNPAAERMFGRSAEEMLGSTCGGEGWEATREDGTPFPADEYPCSVTLRTGEPQFDVAMGMHRPDGSPVWIAVNSAPLISKGEARPHGAVMTFRDITEDRRAEEALRASQRKLSLHLQQTLMGVIEWDAEGRVVEWNPAAEAIFGYSREETLGRPADELIVVNVSEYDLPAEMDKLLHVEGGRFVTSRNTTKDGRVVVCEWVNTPLLDEGGGFVGAMSLVRDITEQRQAEELRIAKEAAEAANAARSAFLANMSHEIRTPMNAILGFSQILRSDRGLSARQHQQLDIITSSGEHLLALVNDVLEMSKVESGRLSAASAVFDLHSLVDEMRSLFGLRSEAKGLQMRVMCAREVPQFVRGDENKLRQILVNLLGNAVKYTDMGRIELRVNVSREDLGGLRLRVEVEDTGRGFAPQERERLFHHFEQVADGTESRTGTGLGLAISREFVRVLGGDLAVESQLGEGSVFRFDIPLEEAGPDEIPAHIARRRVVALRPDGPSPRVLIADDAPDNRELLMQILGPVGFEVASVANGQEAVEAFRDRRPRLILMDMRMPVMDGYDATRRIRSLPGGDEVSIIGVTASAFAEMREGVFDAGVDDFLVKPFREGELFEKIARLLGVHYVYEERAETTVRNGVETLDPAAFAALAGEQRARIRRATTEADFDAVLGIADEIGRSDERLAAGLRTLAERFDAEAILGLVGEAGE